LAYKLGLNAEQVNELARILSELKTERAQAEVNEQRTVAAFADALTEAAFDAEKAGAGAALRVSSAERLREASLKALRQLHVLLDAEQRAKLAYLIRTGIFAL
jgi:Spy/CpxP family protein refolding chaperone